MQQTAHRYRQLDSLRGLGALFVVADHLLGTTDLIQLSKKMRWTPLGILLNGNAALVLFFVLSGYVLSLPFIYGKRPLSITAFYIKRVFRIYPAFICIMLFVLLLKYLVFNNVAVPVYNDWVKQFWDWSMTPDKIHELLKTLLLIGPAFDTHLLDPPIWSLTVEMQMSLVLPLFIIFVSRNKAVVNLILLVVLSWFTYTWHNGWTVSVFYFGVLLAKYSPAIIARISKWGAVNIILLLIFATALYHNFLEVLNWYPQWKATTGYAFSCYIGAVGSAIIIILMVSRPKMAAAFERPSLIFFGDISYSLYLIHMPVMIVVLSVFKVNIAPWYAYPVIIALAVILAYLSSVFIEKPFQNIASRLVKKYPVLNSLNVQSPR